MRNIFLALAAVLASATVGATEPKIGPLVSVTPAEFLKIGEDFQALYVAGAIDAITLVGYGYAIPDHPKFVACMRSATLGEWTARVTKWIRSNPGFDESPATALTIIAGKSCKH